MEIIDRIKDPVVKELIEYKQLFDKALQHPDDLLGRVLSHIRQRKGKMMRPILVLLVAREMGGITEATLHSAVTLELLHTASLVHDDIVDESNERRGQASVNALFNNKIAVLVGDYLLSTSLEQASLTGDVRIVRIISCLGKSLSEGEVFQLSNIQNKEILESAYFDIIRQKTAALFAVSAQLGAVSAGADDEQAENARRFGEIVGTCFQIRDDIFDYFDSKEIGKPTGNDMLEGKLTLPVIFALYKAREEKMFTIAQKVKEGTASDEQISELVKFTKEQGGIEYAEGVMEDLREEGLRVLANFKNDEVRNALTEYLNFVVKRSI